MIKQNFHGRYVSRSQNSKHLSREKNFFWNKSKRNNEETLFSWQMYSFLRFFFIVLQVLFMNSSNEPFFGHLSASPVSFHIVLQLQSFVSVISFLRTWQKVRVYSTGKIRCTFYEHHLVLMEGSKLYLMVNRLPHMWKKSLSSFSHIAYT
jgi:hypothetical protein